MHDENLDDDYLDRLSDALRRLRARRKENPTERAARLERLFVEWFAAYFGVQAGPSATRHTTPLIPVKDAPRLRDAFMAAYALGQFDGARKPTSA